MECPSLVPKLSTAYETLRLVLWILHHKIFAQQTYTSTRKAILRCHPDNDIPTYDQIKRWIVEITGVESIKHDMCVKSCLVYTGPFAELNVCLECGKPQCDPITKKARQTFHTIVRGTPPLLLLAFFISCLSTPSPLFILFHFLIRLAFGHFSYAYISLSHT